MGEITLTSVETCAAFFLFLIFSSYAKGAKRVKTNISFPLCNRETIWLEKITINNALSFPNYLQMHFAAELVKNLKNFKTQRLGRQEEDGLVGGGLHG